MFQPPWRHMKCFYINLYYGSLTVLFLQAILEYGNGQSTPLYLGQHASAFYSSSLSQHWWTATTKKLEFSFSACGNDGLVATYLLHDQVSYVSLFLRKGYFYIEAFGKFGRLEAYINHLLPSGDLHDVVLQDLLSRTPHAKLNGTNSTVVPVILDINYTMVEANSSLFIGQVDASGKTKFLAPENHQSAVVCLHSIAANDTSVDLTKFDSASGIHWGCPVERCPGHMGITLHSQSSYVGIELSTLEVSTSLRLQFWWKGRSAAGSIFAYVVANGGYIHGYLSDSRLVTVQIYDGATAVEYRFPLQRPFNRGVWQEIDLTLSGTNVTLAVDGVMSSLPLKSNGSLAKEHGKALFFGLPRGLSFAPNPPIKSAQYALRGCVSDVWLTHSLNGSVFIDLTGSSTEYRDVKVDGCRPDAACHPKCVGDNRNCADFTCYCNHSQTATTDTHEVCDQFLGNFSVTCDHACENHDTCVSNQTGIFCICRQGFTGKRCETVVKPCEVNPCLNGGGCVPTNTSFICYCASGYRGDLCEININECLHKDKPCSGHGKCMDELEKYYCNCFPGYRGSYCEKTFQDCSSGNPCINGGTCRALNASFVCTCVPGYSGRYCETEIDECSSQPCYANQTCIDGINAHHCVCPPGYTGTACETEINLCLSRPCRNNATCVNQNNTFSCLCPHGFHGLTCELSNCNQTSCLNDGFCIPFQSSFYCLCPTVYTGNRCETRLTECQSSPCLNGGQCVEGIAKNRFHCSCPQNLTGAICEVVYPDPCQSIPCLNNATCVSSGPAYKCHCSEDFTGSHCQSAVDRCVPNRCQNNGKCANVPGGYRCACPSGLEGNHCEFVFAVGFQEESYLAFNGSVPQEFLGVEFSFLTTVCEGVLFYRGPANLWSNLDHVSAELHDGNVYVTYNAGGHIGQQIVGPSAQSDQMWNHLHLSLSSRILDVRLRHGGGDYNVSVDLKSEILGLSDLYFFGGLDTMTTDHKDNLISDSYYNGCVKDVIINGTRQNLQYLLHHKRSPRMGCFRGVSCSQTQCENGGLCEDLWWAPKCHCKPGFSGQTCQIHAVASFSYHTHSVRFGNGQEVINQVKLRIFLTGTNTGVVMSSGEQESFALFFQSKRLKAGFMRDYRKIIVSPDILLSIGTWHSVTLKLNSSQLLLIVDGKEATITHSTVPSSLGHSLFLGHSIYIFGNFLLGTQASFYGCIRDVFFNDKLISFKDGQKSSFFTSLPTSGCTADLCISSTLKCGSHGNCETLGQRAVCKCNSGFAGQNCETAQVATFGERESAARVVLMRSAYSVGRSISLAMRTRSLKGAVLLVEKSETSWTILRIKAGLLSLSVFCQGINYAERNASFIANGQWHNISVHRYRTAYSLTTETQSYFVPSCNETAEHEHFGNGSFRVYVGGLGNGTSSTHSFIGCLGRLEINGRLINLFSDANTNDQRTSLFSVTRNCSSTLRCSQALCSGRGVCAELWNDFTCSCDSGWTGKDCSASINDCAGHFCANNATCLDSLNNYTCLCTPFFTGRYCQTPYDACALYPCRPGSTCVLLPENTPSCACPPGFTGKYCEAELNGCSSLPCFNSASCLPLPQGNFRCYCNSRYTGPLCQYLINSCDSSPCGTNSVCTHVGVNNYSCSCRAGFTGTDCLTEIDPCDGTPCQHGGQCSRGLGVLNFTCNCSHTGHIGRLCEQDIDECLTSLCSHGVCINTPGSYKCDCTGTGFTGKTCESDVNECSSGTSNCSVHGQCFNTVGGYRCDCSDHGYTGQFCETDIDECTSISKPCAHGNCLNAAGSYTCDCKGTGYKGRFCDTNIDECKVNLGLCANNGTCLDLDGGYRCQCTNEFTGRHCENKINACRVANPCQQKANCTLIDGRAYCNCSGTGYRGVNCSVDVNECAEMQPCANGGKCRNLPGKFTCDCSGTGFNGPSCTDDVNECSVSRPCQHGALCDNEIGSYSCNCEGTGYTGKNCSLDVDECATLRPCDHGGKCANTPGSYECDCVTGFRGKNCTEDVDECQDLRPCFHNARCVNLVGSYECDCEGTGYSGKNCHVDIDECLTHVPCQHNSTCINLPGSYSCDCNHTGYRGNNCSQDVDECQEVKPCQNGAACFNTIGSFICRCEGTGYRGVNCSEDINECVTIKPCANHSVCHNVLGNYSCNCTGTGYEGRNCFNDRDECAENPAWCYHGGICRNTWGSYFCNCSGTGYDGKRCHHDRDECVSAPCEGRRVCHNTAGSFQCLCAPGFTGESCESKLTSCQDLPCQNGGRCVVEGLNVSCNCSDTGFTGILCNADVDECSQGLHNCSAQSQCLNIEGSYNCSCELGFTGRYCTELVSPRSSAQAGQHNSSSLYIAVSVASLLLVATMIAIGAFLVRKRASKMEGKYNPRELELQFGPRLQFFPTDPEERLI